MGVDVFDRCNYMVLFIDVYLNIVTWGIFYNPGVASIMAVLEQNKIKLGYFAIFYKKDIKKLFDYIRDNNVQVIGFTVTEPTLESISQLSYKIKNEFPNIYILCGGLYSILEPEEVLKKVVCDAVCIGEGEFATLKLIQGLKNNSSDIYHIKNLWFKKDGEIIKNPFDSPIDINTLPNPNREIFIKNNLDYYQGHVYLKPNEKGCLITISRGCYFNCSFCANWFLNSRYSGKYRRILNPHRAINQLEETLKSFCYDYIIFLDAQFPTDDDWLEEFARLYKKKINIPFTIQLRFGTFTNRTVELLKKAGCYFVQIGLESGDGDIRFKVLNKKIDCQSIINGTEMFKKGQIKIGLNNMIGLPDETPRKFINTIQTNAVLDVDYSYLFIYYPYKGTELYKYCFQNNLLRKQTKNFFLRNNTMLKLKSFKKEDVLYFYKNFQTLVSLYKKSIKSNKMRPIWNILFQIYTICPTKRHGFLGWYLLITEKIFFKKILNYLS